MTKNITCLFLYISCCSVVHAASCPAGFVAREYAEPVPAVSGACPSGYTAHAVTDICGADANGACWLLAITRAACGAGISQIKTSTGLALPLYDSKETTPSIHIKYNNMVCYADLAPGQQSGTINIMHNDVVYHAVK